MSDIFDELVGEEKKEEVKEEKKETTKQTERKAEVQLDELVSDERATTKEEEKPMVNVNNATTKTEEKGGEIEIEEELTTGKEVLLYMVTRVRVRLHWLYRSQERYWRYPSTGRPPQ